MNKSNNRIILALSLPLAILVIITSCTGLFTTDFYSKESLNWQAQSAAQDIVDLFLITPCLIITSVLAFKNIPIAKFLWAGVVLYLIYTFVIFCFDVHFNRLFILYCFELGLSFYSFLFFLLTQIKEDFSDELKKNSISKFTGIYFLGISGIFYLLWIAEIITSIISNTVPKSITEAGLFTNPVHVIDLSVFLPGILITGIFLLRGKALGFLLAPVLLTFFILMDITIGFLKITAEPEGNILLVVIMSILALFSLILLILFLKMKSIINYFFKS